MLRNTTDVFRKTMNFDVWQMVDPIKVGVGLSGTIASHKTLTLVVGMTMAAITKNKNFFKWPKLLYFKPECAQI
jgi:hypothetical protein